MQKIKSSEANTTCIDCALYNGRHHKDKKKIYTVGACTRHYGNALFMQQAFVFIIIIQGSTGAGLLRAR